MSSRFDILLVGQTPPPYHGQAVVTAMLFEHDWGELQVARLRMGYSDSIDAVGKVGLGKLVHLLSLILKTWWIALTKKPEIFYYLPASANRAPVIRDIVYLGAVKWCFPKKVFHYHAGGLPEYLSGAGVIGKLAAWVYSNADVSIDVIETAPPTGSFFKSNTNVCVRNGVDVVKFSRSRPEGDIFQILFVGVLNEGKGILQILETAKRLKQRNCRYHYKIVGDWESPAFQQLVEEMLEQYHLEHDVQFAGPLSGEKKWQAYADADCFFFPSHYEAETFGLVLVEAMAFGLPLVTTRWRGIPQVVEGGNCAILCDVGSPDQFADSLQELAEDVDKRVQMGKAAQNHYHAHYTSEKFVHELGRIFRKLLES